ncbi:MAG: hypothetical protein FJX68_15300 [Alphaproteobacteria bacterium]|nr:hypothetical protein [Alphaproteobacteria bacterium]
MPQFWLEDFIPQLFWLVVAFALFYLLLSRVTLPRIAEVLEARQSRIASDLDKAERLQAEAREALASYEATLAEARNTAQTLLAERLAGVTAEADRKQAALAERLQKEATAAAERIAGSRERALADMSHVAAELAQSAVERLIGVRLGVAEARAAVAQGGGGGG